MTDVEQAELSEYRKLWADLVILLDLPLEIPADTLLWNVEQLVDQVKVSARREMAAKQRQGELAIELHNLKQQLKGTTP